MSDEEIAKLLVARKYDDVLDRIPGQPQALNGLGIQALDRGDAARAAELFAQATASDPQAASVWLNLAKAQRQLDDEEGEAGSLDTILALDQRHFMARIRKAELHERRGETAKAAFNWRAVLALAPPEDKCPAALADLLRHARRFVADCDSALSGSIEHALGPARDRLDGAELRRFDAAVAHSLGKRAIYVNSCAGLHFPFLPADEFFPDSHFNWMAHVEAATPAIRAELQDLLSSGETGFQPYVKLEPGSPATIWTGLDHSAAWSAFYLWEYGKRFDAACERCPNTAAALSGLPQADIPGRAPTAFFSILRPGAHIPPHTGVTNIRATVHLPLIVPPNCGFRVGSETRNWREGKAFAFDDTIEHEAWNESDKLRAVLIFDVWNPHLSEAERSLLRLFYSAADASGHDPEPAKPHR